MNCSHFNTSTRQCRYYFHYIHDPYCLRNSECEAFKPAKDCQSCLVEHDRELKEALKKRVKGYYCESDGSYSTIWRIDSEIWNQFWKERGI